MIPLFAFAPANVTKKAKYEDKVPYLDENGKLSLKRGRNELDHKYYNEEISKFKL